MSILAKKKNAEKNVKKNAKDSHPPLYWDQNVEQDVLTPA